MSFLPHSVRRVLATGLRPIFRLTTRTAQSPLTFSSMPSPIPMFPSSPTADRLSTPVTGALQGQMLEATCKLLAMNAEIRTFTHRLQKPHVSQAARADNATATPRLPDVKRIVEHMSLWHIHLDNLRQQSSVLGRDILAIEQVRYWPVLQAICADLTAALERVEQALFELEEKAVALTLAAVTIPPVCALDAFIAQGTQHHRSIVAQAYEMTWAALVNVNELQRMRASIGSETAALSSTHSKVEREAHGSSYNKFAVDAKIASFQAWVRLYKRIFERDEQWTGNMEELTPGVLASILSGPLRDALAVFQTSLESARRALDVLVQVEARLYRKVLLSLVYDCEELSEELMRRREFRSQDVRAVNDMREQVSDCHRMLQELYTRNRVEKAGSGEKALTLEPKETDFDYGIEGWLFDRQLSLLGKRLLGFLSVEYQTKLMRERLIFRSRWRRWRDRAQNSESESLQEDQVLSYDSLSKSQFRVRNALRALRPRRLDETWARAKKQLDECGRPSGLPRSRVLWMNQLSRPGGSLELPYRWRNSVSDKIEALRAMTSSAASSSCSMS